ncbi:hypothetical protein UC41_29175, partial [Escherichia coli]
NLPPRPFSIRMRRMTPDSTTDQLQNKTLWSSYTEIIDVKQCYPNTALVGVQVDSEQFGSQQVSRNYHSEILSEGLVNKGIIFNMKMSSGNVYIA